MLSFIFGCTVFGIDAYPIRVETDISSGLPGVTIVGLPDKAVSEAKERVKSAICNAGFKFPSGRITINLAPGDIKKSGVLFDLPIALGILIASGEIEVKNPERFTVVGELSLDALVRKVDGILPMAVELSKNPESIFIVPYENRLEASIIENLQVYPVKTLSEAIDVVTGLKEYEKVRTTPIDEESHFELDFSDVKGHAAAKRALEISAAGNHNILMIGTPGSGKSMLAKRIPTILPPLSFDEALEVTRIYSIRGMVDDSRPIIYERPFREPHCSSSYAGLVGGGTIPQPGEISFAHKGVLFLDELPEFKRDVIEMLRQPMEDGKVVVSRSQHSYSFPASFMLVASMNPCPCGFWGDKDRECSCSELTRKKYFSRISGPIMDRIDIHINVPRLSTDEIKNGKKSESSKEIRDRVNRCRAVQKRRYQGIKAKCNGELNPKEIELYCVCERDASDLLYKSMEKMHMTARAYSKILKLARTIADLEESPTILKEHIAEAISYRMLDRNYI